MLERNRLHSTCVGNGVQIGYSPQMFLIYMDVEEREESDALLRG